MTKDEEYTNYITEHINNVQQVWADIEPLLEGEYWLDDMLYFTIQPLIERHDESKYTPLEFNGYRQFFYPKDGETKNKMEFQKSWCRHQNSNPHHWEYWTMLNDKLEAFAIEMPFVYIIEMLCDWTAMSYKFGDTPSDFYNKNYQKMLLSDSTKRCIHSWIKLFDIVANDHANKQGEIA